MQEITSKELKQLEQKLLGLLEDLNQQIELAQPGASTVVLDQSKVGRLSRMDAMQQQNMADSLLKETQKRFSLARKALKKIENGDYSYCESCGEEIGFARLQVKPEALLCLSCQSAQE